MRLMTATFPQTYRFFLSGEYALTLEIADEISISATEIIHHCLFVLKSAPILGVIDVIPAYTTITFVFDLCTLLKHTSHPHKYLQNELLQRLEPILQHHELPSQSTETSRQPHIIPVCYESAFAPDIEECATQHHLTTDELIELHSAVEYRVAMVGFTPAFPYLLGLPDILATPRRQTPRLRVEAGSVGIAGLQTGIYPLSTPGGWNIIGRTPLRLFSPDKMPPVLLQSGDLVLFQAISIREFWEMNGVYCELVL